MNTTLSETLQVIHKDMSFIQSTPIIMSLSLPVEEGHSIVTVPRKHRMLLLPHEREIARKLLNHILKYAKKKEEPLTLKETIQIINDFVEGYHSKILEYIRDIVQDKLRGIIEIKNSHIEIINKEKYINIVLKTYEDVRDSLLTLILRSLQERNKGKITNIRAHIKILYSLIDIISLAKICIEINRTYSHVLELLGILNIIVTVTLLRDLVLLKIAEKINEDKVMSVINEESQLIKVIGELILDPDKVLSLR